MKNQETQIHLRASTLAKESYEAICLLSFQPSLVTSLDEVQYLAKRVLYS